MIHVDTFIALIFLQRFWTTYFGVCRCSSFGIVLESLKNRRVCKQDRATELLQWRVSKFWRAKEYGEYEIFMQNINSCGSLTILWIWRVYADYESFGSLRHMVNMKYVWRIWNFDSLRNMMNMMKLWGIYKEGIKITKVLEANNTIFLSKA